MPLSSQKTVTSPLLPKQDEVPQFSSSTISSCVISSDPTAFTTSKVDVSTNSDNAVQYDRNNEAMKQRPPPTIAAAINRLSSSFPQDHRHQTMRGTRAGRKRRNRRHSSGRGSKWESLPSPDSTTTTINDNLISQGACEGLIVPSPRLQVPVPLRNETLKVTLHDHTRGPSSPKKTVTINVTRDIPVNVLLSAALSEQVYVSNENRIRVLFDGERVDQHVSVGALANEDDEPIVLEIFPITVGGAEEGDEGDHHTASDSMDVDEEVLHPLRVSRLTTRNTQVANSLMEVDESNDHPPSSQRYDILQPQVFQQSSSLRSCLNPAAAEWVPGRSVEDAAMAVAASVQERQASSAVHNNTRSTSSNNLTTPTRRGPGPLRGSKNKNPRSNSRSDGGRHSHNTASISTSLNWPSGYDMPTLRQSRIALDVENDEIWYNSGSDQEFSRIMTRSQTQEAIIGGQYPYLPNLNKKNSHS